MALDKEIQNQLAQYLQLLESDVVFEADFGGDEASAQKVRDFLEEITNMSPKLSLKEVELSRKPAFTLTSKAHNPSGIFFAGLPLGHEFTSFVLALLQVSGRAPKIDDAVAKRIKSINDNLNFETYVSLTCHNCPDVVQSLNIMAVLNPNITSWMIEGGMFESEIEERGIMAVPTVFLNGQEFANGRMSIEELVDKTIGSADLASFDDKGVFDSLIIGGGPAAASAAIYSARKGIKTGIVADKFGGQVVETVGIENMIGTPYTEGPKLMSSVESHVNGYDVDIMKGQKAVDIRSGEVVEIELESGAVLKSNSVILSVGASWRNINVPGEKEFRNKGVTYCPHCDGPLFEGKKVAVIGGGNSGVEAALDLAGIASHVYLIEFDTQMRADKVLLDKVAETSNITPIVNAATKEITGNNHVENLVYNDRTSGEEIVLDLEGVFVQIGLVPNTSWLKGKVDLNNRGEIITDKHGQTSLEGVFAAGDCTDSAYKQIIISMGSGATAALGAFDYLLRK